MFDKIFVSLSPQVKRIVIISNKHGMYKLPHELPTQNLELRKLVNIKKISKPHRIIARRSVSLPKLKFCQYQQRTLEKQKLNFSRRVLFHSKTTACLKYLGQDCSPHCRCHPLSHSPPQQNFRQLFFSPRKVWGYPTSLISWFINFNAAIITKGRRYLIAFGANLKCLP